MNARPVLVSGTAIEPLSVGPISAAEVAAFAEHSGDNNPIHVDAATARRAGLSASPVPGMQLVAWLHAAACRLDRAFDVTGLSTRFLAPVFVGETIEITGRIVHVDAGQERAVMRLFVRTAAGGLASIAEATLVAAGVKGAA
jgi:acyl dehydratase